MKKRISGMALILAVLMCFLTVGAFAAEKSNSFSVPDSAEEAVPVFPELYEETGEYSDEEIFEDSKEFFILWFSMMFSGFLFMPALVLVIVFAVFNSNTKKKIKDYERIYGPVPQNMGYNAYYSPNTVYRNNPANSYNTFDQPQNNYNNQQGGQF